MTYIFFMQAKIDYDTAVQRSEYESLMEDAVFTLGESVADVATAAASADNGVSKTAMVNSVVNSLKKECQRETTAYLRKLPVGGIKKKP